MKISVILLTAPCLLALASAAPVHAQHVHSQAATACTAEHAAMGHCLLPETHVHPPHGEAEQDNADCSPEHAAMGHCVMSEAHSHHSHGEAENSDPGCTAEHAAMGHCVVKEPAPLEPLEPIPVLTDADRAAAFPQLKSHHAHAGGLHWRLLMNNFEVWDADPRTGQAWSGSFWIGGDVNRLRIKSSGERHGGDTTSANVQAFYSRSVTPWWDLVAGVKQDFQPDSRTWGAIGVQGLAPYLFEVSAMAYAGSGGQVQVKLEAEYEILFTNRLILQPSVEVTASLTDEPELGIGSGLGKLETGLRLRYEITRRFAPYIGLVHERAAGNTADIARNQGGHDRDTRVVAGIRFWF